MSDLFGIIFLFLLIMFDPMAGQHVIWGLFYFLYRWESSHNYCRLDLQIMGR